MTDLGLPERFADVKRLPSLPHDVHQVVKALSNDNLDYAQLAKILAGHATITSRLIALANSAWFNNSSEPVTSLERTCQKLGLNVVRGVGIGLAVMKPFNVRGCRSFDIKRYWISTMLVAHAARALADESVSERGNEHLAQTVHTGGILHNIGLLCMADIMPEETHQALRFKQSDSELDLNQALRRVLQTDYCEVGAHLAYSWGIPEALVAIIRYHRNLGYEGSHWRQAALVGAAAHMVGSLFDNKETWPVAAFEKLALSQACQAELFADLQVQFLKTQELAKVLFR
ncbi:HDOD domain-containing protein [Methylomonas albis]|uniref:HDOD domain-containing protein n=1 Tax=Methylomonas albis TaxID=1854563 RepID=A0ABR9D0E2_9GAMM|nr:HDOD domain-containing protein [Methylomonas albis]MBD9356599.1 HDOD domain-containing protein [Methylomonas albis]